MVFVQFCRSFQQKILLFLRSRYNQVRQFQKNTRSNKIKWEKFQFYWEIQRLRNEKSVWILTNFLGKFFRKCFLRVFSVYRFQSFETTCENDSFPLRFLVYLCCVSCFFNVFFAFLQSLSCFSFLQRAFQVFFSFPVHFLACYFLKWIQK